MMPMSLVAAVAPRTVKFNKSGLLMFLEEENDFLQNGILHFVFSFHSIVRNRESWNLRTPKTDFSERGLVLKRF